MTHSGRNVAKALRGSFSPIDDDGLPGEKGRLAGQEQDRVGNLLGRRATLAENRIDRKTGAHAKQPSLLAGLVFDETGERLTPSHAVKKGTRYRYYVSRSLIVGSAKDHLNGRRIPAGNLESLVINRLRTFLTDQGAILDAVREEHPDGTHQKRFILRGREIAEELPTMAPDQTRAMLMVLLARVDLKLDRVEIKMHRRSLVELLNADSTALSMEGRESYGDSEDILTLV